MAGFCKIFVLGNVGQEPQVKVFDNGDIKTSFSVAASDQWTDKNGEKKESTEWFNVVCYRQLGKIASDLVKKGSKVFIEGRLKTSSWEKDGVKHYKTEVETLKLRVLDKKDSAKEVLYTDESPF